MDDFIQLVLSNANTLSIVVVLILVLAYYVWAMQTERLFSGPRGREMQKTITEQAQALRVANEALHDVELDYERLRVMYELRDEDFVSERSRRRR